MPMGNLEIKYKRATETLPPFARGTLGVVLFVATAIGGVAAMLAMIAWPGLAIEEIADDGKFASVAGTALYVTGVAATFLFWKAAVDRTFPAAAVRARRSLRRGAIPLAIIGGALTIAGVLAFGNASYVIEHRDGYTRVNRFDGTATRCWTEPAMRADARGDLGWWPPGCIEIR